MQAIVTGSNIDCETLTGSNGIIYGSNSTLIIGGSASVSFFRNLTSFYLTV